MCTWASSVWTTFTVRFSYYTHLWHIYSIWNTCLILRVSLREQGAVTYRRGLEEVAAHVYDSLYWSIWNLGKWPSTATSPFGLLLYASCLGLQTDGQATPILPDRHLWRENLPLKKVHYEQFPILFYFFIRIVQSLNWRNSNIKSAGLWQIIFPAAPLDATPNQSLKCKWVKLRPSMCWVF